MNLAKFQKCGHFLYKHNVPILPYLIHVLQFILFNSNVPPEVVIGPRTRFAYRGIGCVVHKRTIIGAGCMLGQGITIGGRNKSFAVPIIGNNCFIGAGARLLGPISIGNNVIVGPNAVVLMDIPDNCVVVGIPARIIKRNIKSIKEYI